MKALEGKTAVVAGAASGIGKRFALTHSRKPNKKGGPPRRAHP